MAFSLLSIAIKLSWFSWDIRASLVVRRPRNSYYQIVVNKARLDEAGARLQIIPKSMCRMPLHARMCIWIQNYYNFIKTSIISIKVPPSNAIAVLWTISNERITYTDNNTITESDIEWSKSTPNDFRRIRIHTKRTNIARIPIMFSYLFWFNL